ncbi:archaellin/type IV pilin N-terminal domain-containing protein [Halorussus lipolyticus]|uniref:archaellin/type IV pilin N-terminal domain-containing protein n=1 Tax=Halorussus lipolyticus TaxID=3034024 RepID=UPI0023E7FDC2|nr:archaellin/type IV pilin N-terminal domain-containing protein [Halorussus sp. DT80]
MNDASEARSQVGIGTLIVFVAMVLVAAIAAGVLVHSAGFLQSESETTGQESVGQTTDRVRVVSSVGRLDAVYNIRDDNIVVGEDGNVITGSVVDSDKVQGSVVTADGRNVVLDASDNVVAADSTNVVSANGENIRESTGLGGEIIADGSSLEYAVELGSSDNIITYGGGGGTQYNVETDSGTNVVLNPDASFVDNEPVTAPNVTEIGLVVTKGSGASDVDLDGVTVQYLGPNGKTTLVRNGTASAERPDVFDVTAITSDSSPNVLTDADERLRIDISLTEDANGELRPLEESETAEVTITTQSGATTTILLEVPRSLPSDKIAVSL